MEFVISFQNEKGHCSPSPFIHVTNLQGHLWQLTMPLFANVAGM